MNVDLATLIGVLGGWEGIKWIIMAIINRRTNARKEDASADAMVDENYRKQVGWLEERVAQRDTKIDALYAELREVEGDRLNWVHKCHEAELALKDAEHNRCDRPDSECGRRVPPRRHQLIKQQES